MASAAVASTLSDPYSVFANSAQDQVKPIAVVFWEDEFPSIDGCGITRELLQQSLTPFNVSFVSQAELQSRLEQSKVDLFITPFGSAFPKRAFRSFFNYLKAGGNWLNLGGAPLSVPVARAGSRWQVEQPQAAYHKRLGITQTFPVAAGGLRCELAEGGEPLGPSSINVQKVFELYLRLSSSSNEPEESGSDGPREAVVHPLVFALNHEGRRLAAPVIQIDRLQADFEGGRWILANFSGNILAQAIEALAVRASRGAIHFEVNSSYACYRDGESVSLSVRVVRKKGGLEQMIDSECNLEVRDSSNNLVEKISIPLSTTTSDNATLARGTRSINARLPAGFYRIHGQTTLLATTNSPGSSLTGTNGFWVGSNPLTSPKPGLTVDHQFFYRSGNVYPITGTTYMASDVHRQFLFDPNPLVWDNDFREMKAAGVNMVRTGIWTGWKKYMPELGKLNETTMRAFDAFLLTADKYDIPVIFTFFAFLPETWGGTNAYLDPRALNAQREFVAAFAQRYARIDSLIWDLINEPSFCSPQHLWSCRPNYDEHEKSAWRQWLQERYPNTSEEARVSQLQQLWRSTDADPLELPKPSDFDNVNLIDERQPLKTLDYRLFAQDMFARWVRQMTGAIRSNGNPRQLVTVGQDEAGLADSPNPHFFGPAVDFTSIHNWWANDDLVWDSVLAKTAAKASLVEETGIMFYEKTTGDVWRTEQEASNLLERKMAISMAVEGAGFIEWIWNTNPYMNSTNEVGIGFHRVDQTAKPELAPFLEISQFFAMHAKLVREKQPAQVAMVVPHSQMFAPRTTAVEATRRCVRAMFYHCQLPMQALSEYNLKETSDETKLFIVPAPRVLSNECWAELLRRVEQGATIAISGVINADEHWLEVDRATHFGWKAETNIVAESESITIGGHRYLLRYEGEKMQRVEKAVIKSALLRNQPLIARRGAGRIAWCPLPLELSDSMEALTAFYRTALTLAGVSSSFTVLPQVPSVLTLASVFRDAVLFTFVSETDHDVSLRVRYRETRTSFPVTVPAGRTKFVMINRKTGVQL